MKQPALSSPELDLRRSSVIAIPCTDYFADAQSDESLSVRRLAYQAFLHYYVPISRLDEDSVRRFYTLKARWENDIRLISDTNEICTHEAYQKIIGMGDKALPFIYYELQQEPDHWFWALKAITCEDPVPIESRGNLQLMANAWLKWLNARQSRWSHPEQYQGFPMFFCGDSASRSALFNMARQLTTVPVMEQRLSYER